MLGLERDPRQVTAVTCKSGPPGPLVTFVIWSYGRETDIFPVASSKHLRKDPHFQEGSDFPMSSKTGAWIIAAGSLLVFGGLCVLASGLSDRSDSTTLGFGLLVFSLGLLVIASGVYLKARFLSGNQKGEAAEEAKPRPVRGGCDLCGTETPVIHCKVHQVHLCGTCLARHYDFRSCAYVPSTRRATPKAAPKGMAARRGNA